MLLSSDIQNKLRERYNPENSKLRDYQLSILGILIDIDKICLENNINYWISCGTVLGAVRHGGFIPWDDDIDISMSFSDFKKLKEILHSNSKYVLQTHSNDKSYTFPFGKVRIRNCNIEINEQSLRDIDYKFKSPFIDVFPIGNKNQDWVINLSARCCGWLHRPSKIKNKLLRKLVRTILYNSIYYFIRPLALIFSKQDKTFCGYRFGTPNWKEPRRTSVFPLSTISFENHIFKSPGNPHEYLREIYGNYEDIPSEIATHLIHSHK